MGLFRVISRLNLSRSGGAAKRKGAAGCSDKYLSYLVGSAGFVIIQHVTLVSPFDTINGTDVTLQENCMDQFKYPT